MAEPYFLTSAFSMSALSPASVRYTAVDNA
jgi:hypothetical protein